MILALQLESATVVVNQARAMVGDRLRQSGLNVEVVQGADTSPWCVDSRAHILILGHSSSWIGAPLTKPPGWPSGLRWIQAQSAGVDSYPKWLLESAVVTLGKGLTAGPIAEYVGAAILRHERPLESLAVASSRAWTPLSANKLSEKTVGVLGYGAVGEAIAARAYRLGMRVKVLRNGPWTRIPSHIEPVTDVHKLFTESDHLVLALPLTTQTERLVNAELLAKAKPGMHVINIARGGLIDHEALLEALQKGHIAGATLDVTSPEPLPDKHPLYSQPNVLITPHCAWYSPGFEEDFSDRVVENMRRYLAGVPLLFPLDLRRGY